MNTHALYPQKNIHVPYSVSANAGHVTGSALNSQLMSVRF